MLSSWEEVDCSEYKGVAFDAVHGIHHHSMDPSGSGGSSEICVEQSPSGTPEFSSLEASREPLSDFIGPLFSSSDTESKTGSMSGGSVLPWGAHKERSPYPSTVNIDVEIKPGEFVMRTLFADFTVQTERKMEAVMNEPLEKPLSKVLQRGEDLQFDQLLSALGSVAEHCLPSLLRSLFAWYDRQMAEGAVPELRKVDVKGKSNEVPEKTEAETAHERRDLAVEFIFCLVLIEVLRQLPFHPGHEDLVGVIETMAFRHFKYREGTQSSPNAANIHIVADLYAEVIGALAQSRFMSVRKRFMAELKELRAKEPSPHATQSIISLLMGMKFFRVKMVPIEEFEASFQFMQECAQYFLDVKDKDIKHALAGLFVEILVPVAAAVKNEVNVPCLKNFVEMLYSQTLDMCTKSKHRLALFPLVTCLLCVSQKTFFLQSWHCFLAICLQHLKNKDPKMCRVALESLYRLLWVYMIRIKCESNTATHSRLQSIVNSLFPKGSKAVVPRDTPLNIFVKIIQFIAQERLDFAMREIVFDLLSVGRPIKIILTPERMSIGLRAFLVVADSLQQKEGEPPMPRTVGVMPSGSTLRVKKTYLNKMLTEDTARSIGMAPYFPHVRRVFVDILRALDTQYGRPLMMTSTQNVNKEPDEMITGERKPRIDLFRTCVAAVPRLVPDGMTGAELVDLLARLTVHMDEELRGLAYQSLQTLVLDFPDWRQDVICGFTHFLARDVQDTFPQLVDNGLRMLLQLLTSWKNALSNPPPSTAQSRLRDNDPTRAPRRESSGPRKIDLPKAENVWTVLHQTEGLALVMLCQIRLCPRRLAVHILREVKTLLKVLNTPIPSSASNVPDSDEPVVDVIDRCCPAVIEKCLGLLPPSEKAAVLASSNVDLQWIAERSSSVWTAGLPDEGSTKTSSTLNLTGADPWSLCLFEFLERERVLTCCPAAVAHAWPMVFTRVQSLFTVIDPTPVSDNRASLLRGSTTVRKPVNERDVHMHAWRNYVTFAFRVVPPVPNPVVRCASPDLSLREELMMFSSSLTSTFTSSSPDSLNAERSDGTASPSALYKLVVPLLRCEAQDVRDAAVHAMGKANPDAIKDLMEELIIYIREAVDRKQENMRRRKRRDALRLQLIRVFDLIAEFGTFGISPNVLDRETMSLHPTFIEYLEGARLFLELEAEKDIQAVQEIKLCFGNFIRKMIKSFPLETCKTLLKRDLRSNLFNLFAGWTGRFGQALGLPVGEEKPCQELELSALQAMSALLCCGTVFSPQVLAEDGSLYPWLDMLMASKDEKIHELGKETVVLLLECNPDIGPLLDWVVDRCYTAPAEVADGCFLALATIFSVREYPCDHYTAVINVALINTGCPRMVVHETALQLLQVLDKRFFGTVGPLSSEADGGGETLDLLLSASYCRSQMYKLLPDLHPELTMPMFSEITYRFQTARPAVRQLLLQYLLPWLYNMELVDPNVPPANPLSYFQYYTNEVSRIGGRREGWGSAEATEMVLNNLFYITAKFSDEHPKAVEELWATLCACWPNNLKVIIRYLLIISGMAPQELLPFTKRVVLYLARSRPDRLLDEMMAELQTVETLNCLIERTETPPFYRLTSMRKASSHSDGPAGMSGQAEQSRNELAVEKGTIHTKRHSGEDPVKSGHYSSKSDSALRALSGYSSNRGERTRAGSGPAQLPDDPSPPSTAEPETVDEGRRFELPQPHPLPMPEYGGYFAPLTEYLPESSHPISGFHRCNVAVMLLTDVVVDVSELDWSIHVPLMLHILFLGLDHTRPLVHEHCKALLLNLLVVLADHKDHLAIAQILLSCKTRCLGLGLNIPALPVLSHNFTEPDPEWDSYLQTAVALPACSSGQNSGQSSLSSGEMTSSTVCSTPVIITPDDRASTSLPPFLPTKPSPNMPIQDVVKALVNFLASRQNQPLWAYEDITAKVWSVRSADQLDTFLQHVARVFRESLPHAVISERWAQTALQLGLSCSSRHYAGRSLQVFRALRVPITGRMLSDILSRLVETVSEQGEDMQGYVTELLLTLEAAVDSLESDFRPLDFMKEIFKSTPNLNNKELVGGKRSPMGGVCGAPLTPQLGREGHARSTSYSVSYCVRKQTATPATDSKVTEGMRARAATELEARSGSSIKYSTNLSRSRSAQSLKLLGDSSSMDDKMTILAQLFWVAVSLLESDYEHEFLLALRLLSRVLHRLPLDRPDARDKVEKLQSQLRWSGFPGVHALLLKGCTSPTTYEAVVPLLSQFTPLLDLPVVDPSQTLAFPVNVIALLPYMLLNFEDANELCIRSAENVAQASAERGKKLENLGTVMTLYSRRNFSKESFQWTKCVVKYLYDTYAHLSLNILSFLVEVLEKGPPALQPPVLNIIHCLLHYVDLNSAAAQTINADLLRVIARYIGGTHWREALKILKLVVTRSSSLVAPPIASHHQWESSPSPSIHPSFTENEMFTKKELPGRTMEFTFDLSQTPVIGRRYLPGKEEKGGHANASPRRSVSLSPADSGQLAGWKRPWTCQGRVRECLVNVLTTCGQRVGLPKSPSVIFSQSSDLMERQSSMASSTEEVSGPNDLSGGSRRDDAAQDQFGVFKDFDFLEYESESVEGETTDNFNWGVRRRPLLDGQVERDPLSSAMEESVSEDTPVLSKKRRGLIDESSDDEVGSESPLDEVAVAPDFEGSAGTHPLSVFPPTSLDLRERRPSAAHSDTSGSSGGDLGDVTPCNASPNLSALMTFRPILRDDAEEAWRRQMLRVLNQTSSTTLHMFQRLGHLLRDVVSKAVLVTRDSCSQLGPRSLSQFCVGLSQLCELLATRAAPPYIWFCVDPLQEPKLRDSLRFGMIDVQEHLETFLDRKDHVAECIDGIKTSVKLQLLNEEEIETSHEMVLELGKALYKLHFQLLLLLESAYKMLTHLVNLSRGLQLVDISSDVSAVRAALLKAVDDVGQSDTPSVSPGPILTGTRPEEEAEALLMELVAAADWVAALRQARRCRGIWRGDAQADEDDATGVLNAYCKLLAQDKTGAFAVTGSEGELGEVSGSLRESLYQVLGALNAAEAQEPRRKTEC